MTLRSVLVCQFIILGAVSFVSLREVAAQEVSFNRDVRPILSDKCFHCHGPDADNQESDFRLDTRDHALDAIEPGSIEDSELHERVYADDDSVMPPADAPRQLTDAEKSTLKRWIEQGAEFEGHWAFEPVPGSIEVPEVDDASWTRNAIDHFILDAMTKEGMQPNVPASREKWLRRVTFDLTGLPPTLEQIDAFLADESEDAFEKVVDRLLESEECAERLTSEWLDVARYSDSYGFQRDDERYVWPYRDWVIRAFKQNMPYDQFVSWQLAGDLMENPTRDQIVATAFNRLHSHKKEGGVAVEEFRVENVADRTHTFSAAFMGLTMECARCHDHKYDPTKTKEYYQLSSFFANVDENGLISYFTDAVPTPAAPLPTKSQQEELKKAEAEIANAESEYASVIAGQEQAFQQWLKQDSKDIDPIPRRIAKLSFDQPVAVVEKKDDKKEEPSSDAKSKPEIVEVDPDADTKTEKPWDKTAQKIVDGPFGKAIELTGDDPVTFPGVGRFERHQPFTVSIWIKTNELKDRGVIWRRSRGWDDAGSVGYELVKLGNKLSAKMCHFWPGNAIDVETDAILEKDRWYHVAVSYDGSSKAAGLKIYVDGKPAGTKIVKDHLTRQVSRWRGGFDDFAIGSRYRDRGFKDGQVDEFQMFDRELAPIEIAMLSQPSATHDASLADHKKDHEQARQWYFAAYSKPAAEAREKLKQARAKWNGIMDSVPAITVMRETDSPRDTFLLERGVYDAHGEKVSPATPAFLPEFPADAPKNRLGLARWITSPDHPLTARVTVNRYWQMMFANGLVRTPEDFGLQSEMPSHPELLDWLARDFVSSGWDVRRMLKKMALSSTYRQSATVARGVRDRDPENRLLARAPGNRLTAEMLRDGVLFVSGQLKQKVGGPPVKPYDVALAYNPLKVDTGDALYRRSLYTYWKRSSPAPVMMTMDASKRDVCRLRREVTASPLQALVLLNGTQFVEASKVLAEKLLKQHDGDAEKIIQEAFRLMTSRTASSEEIRILETLYEEQLKEFEASPEQATKLLQTGQATAGDDVGAPELAAATVLVNAILNLDESVRLR
ncbi:DUF1553 domain-containing protein [Mariniblastus fucicola]|uniref:Planctomycete cytochrome C n=1 Tax=Mariniblastus fucicola TaxID=980251 RepID=A0A5B9PH03_9BACT|nr:DUF1553 domain-containing protein [Mariniblastus fucicola]QEG24525.1 Planctomycete cytochrome C [Mariniblastus fucicola]